MDRRIATEWEKKEEERIHRLKESHEELRLRFLNPRIRLTGRDIQAHARQIAEKTAMRERERNEDLEYMKNVSAAVEKVNELDIATAAQIRNQNMELVEDWKREARRKEHERRQALAEYHRKEANLGPSCAQELDGEDDFAGQRKALQAEQLRRWVAQQTAEREQRLREEQKHDLDFDAHVLEYTKECERREAEHQALKAQQRREIMNYNQLQAKKKADDARFQREMENEEKIAEDPTFTQEKVAKISYSADGKIRPDHFTGLKREQLERIRQDQLEQMRLSQLQKEKNDAEERAFARQQERLIKAANQAAYEEELARRALNKETFEFQQRQIEERRNRVEQVRKSGEISHEFFLGFGRSHR